MYRILIISIKKASLEHVDDLVYNFTVYYHHLIHNVLIRRGSNGKLYVVVMLEKNNVESFLTLFKEYIENWNLTYKLEYPKDLSIVAKIAGYTSFSTRYYFSRDSFYHVIKFYNNCEYSVVKEFFEHNFSKSNKQHEKGK